MLKPLPPVSHVVHQLLSPSFSFSLSPLFLPPSPRDLERAFAFAFASRCSLKRLGTPSGLIGSGNGPNATERGVDRPEDVALGTVGTGLRRSDIDDEDAPGSVCNGGGRRFRDEWRGGDRGRVEVECEPFVKRREMLVVVVDVLDTGPTGGVRGRKDGGGRLLSGCLPFKSEGLVSIGCSSRILRKDSRVRRGWGLSELDESDCDGNSCIGGGRMRGSKCGDGRRLDDRERERCR